MRFSEPKVQPVLTEHEWDEILLGGRDMRSLLSHYGDCVDVLADLGEPRRDAAGCHRVLVALANHALPEDDPRKITRELVDRLRTAAFNAPYGYSGEVWLDDLADRLESYLPPK